MNYEVTVLGMVQGIGFRPFVAGLADDMHIRGSVCNQGGIVTIECTCERSELEQFLERLQNEAPVGAQILDLRVREIDDVGAAKPDREVEVGNLRQKQQPGTIPIDSEHQSRQPHVSGHAGFRITESRSRAESDLVILPPDLGLCEDCRRELLNPRNRRFHYPFISCTLCGPRYSIMDLIPYDRERITMRAYEMCDTCHREYTEPCGRRRHAQTISCHDCGPQLLLRKGNLELEGEDALQECLQILSSGGVLALKGIGGYLLACKANNTDAVNCIRRLKQREKKPFAVMFPDLNSIENICLVSKKERTLLKDSAAPIVLLKKKYQETDEIDAAQSGGAVIAENVCPGSPEVGAFLPYTGLHELLVGAIGPLVMTSANITSEPIIYTEERMEELAFSPDGKACIDGVAWNTREIVTPTDDSVVRVIGDRVQFMRRSRGYVPLPVKLSQSERSAQDESIGHVPASIDSMDDHCVTEEERCAISDGTMDMLAFGGDLKATFALKREEWVYPSQYFGDLEHYAVEQAYRHNLEHMRCMLRIHPQILVCDLHPGYVSHQLAVQMAEEMHLPLIQIQHHQAHVASVMAEHELTHAIGVAMDGTGYGTDGAIWGCEFFSVTEDHAEMVREGHLSYTTLVGGDAASKDAKQTLLCQLLHCDLTQEHTATEGKEEHADRPDTQRLEGHATQEPESSMGDWQSDPNSKLLKAAIEHQINTSQNGSMGRLFDAVAALLGIASYNHYEGECAIALENAAQRALDRERVELKADYAAADSENDPMQEACELTTSEGYAVEQEVSKGEAGKLRFIIKEDEAGHLLIDRDDFLRQLLAAANRHPDRESAERLALAFHRAVVEMIAEMCIRIRKKTGEQMVVFSGGVFANVLLCTQTEKRLEQEGFRVFFQEAVPANDGGLALGQCALAAKIVKEEKLCV